MKNIDKQTAERFKQLERKRKRRKKKRKEKKIETIGKRNIELGRDTYGIEKKNQHMTIHRTTKTSRNLKLTEEGGLLLGISLGMPHTSPVLEMENAFVCDGRKH